MISRCSSHIFGLFLFLMLSGIGTAKGIRDHTRIKNNTSVTPSQAHELTLTLVKIEKQAIQTWVRAAANIDLSRKNLSAHICSFEAKFIKAGQRVRAFPPGSKSSIYQARVTQLTRHKDCVLINVELTRKAFGVDKTYVLEVIIERGVYLAIPNEAIIEEENYTLAYIQQHQNHFVPKVIAMGVKGELYTQVTMGLKTGDLAVTFGSFFIDAEYKLKQFRGSYAHQHH